MSKYTITLRNIEEILGHEKLKKFFMDYELTDFLTNEEIETITEKNTWSKEKLAEKIINHYYFDEIGVETIEMFRRRTKILLEEIMESKLPLIYSNSVKYDMLVNVDFIETFDRNVNSTGENKASSNTSGNNSSNSNSNSESLSKYTDTPQNAIQNLRDELYVSNATLTNNNSNITDSTESSSNSSSESSGKSNNVEHYERKQKGNSGALTTSQKLIEQYRSIIVSIDRDIIKELSELFMRSFLKIERRIFMNKPLNLSFHKFCVSIGSMPSTYIESLSYYEQILWLCKYLEEEVIPTVNNNSEVVSELQKLFEQLQDYVNHYFDNLDVQEEINNKLDEMALNGSLDIIINKYISNKMIRSYNNIEEMKKDTSLFANCKVKTYGYYEANDGGAGLYRIVYDDTLTDDGGSVHNLDNGLKAELIKNGKINVKQFGAYGDGEHDDTQAIQNAISSSHGIIYIDKGTYCISDTIELINSETSIIGAGRNSSIVKLLQNSTTINAIFKTSKPFCRIEHLGIFGDGTKNNKMVGGLYIGNGSYHCTFNDLLVRYINGNGVYSQFKAYDIQLSQILVSNVSEHGYFIDATDNFLDRCISSYTDRNGFYIRRGNNLLNQCKTYFTGLINRNITRQEDMTNTGAGFFIDSHEGYLAHSNRLINCEAQECGSHGFQIYNANSTQLIACQADTNGCYLENSCGFLLEKAKYTKLTGNVTNKEFIGGVDKDKLGKHDYGVKVIEGAFNDININVETLDYYDRDQGVSTKFYKENCETDYSVTNKIIINGVNMQQYNFEQKMYEDENNDGITNNFVGGGAGTNIEKSFSIDLKERCQKIEILNSSSGSINDNAKLTLTQSIQKNYEKLSLYIEKKEDEENTNVNLFFRVGFYDSSNTLLSETLKSSKQSYFSSNENSIFFWNPFSIDYKIPTNSTYYTLEIFLSVAAVGGSGIAYVRNLKTLLS